MRAGQFNWFSHAAAAVVPVILIACGQDKGRTKQTPAIPEYELISGDELDSTGERESAPARVSKPDWEWEQLLTELQFRVMRRGETEPRFTGDLYKETRNGVYRCIGCDSALFASSAKYTTELGWPTFSSSISNEVVSTKPDDTAFRQRIAVQCRGCDAHLGHIFDDGPKPEGTRYSINASALKFVPK